MSLVALLSLSSVGQMELIALFEYVSHIIDFNKGSTAIFAKRPGQIGYLVV